MTKKTKEIEHPHSLTELVKDKVKTHILDFQKKAMDYVEEQIEEKVTKELNRFFANIFGFILIILGSLFTIYSIVWFIVSYMTIPQETTPLIVGVLFIIIGLILKKKNSQ